MGQLVVCRQFTYPRRSITSHHFALSSHFSSATCSFPFSDFNDEGSPLDLSGSSERGALAPQKAAKGLYNSISLIVCVVRPYEALGALHTYRGFLPVLYLTLSRKTAPSSLHSNFLPGGARSCNFCFLQPD